MHLHFINLVIHNFGPYEHAEISLEHRNFCAVKGINQCPTDNAKSNGSGKSYLFNAICFVLTGTTLQGNKSSSLKNLHATDAQSYVTINFKADTDSFSLTRYLAPKSDLKITVNGLDESGKGIVESEKRLKELLPDLTANLIASTFLLGQGLPSKFSSYKPNGRKEILEELTKSDFMIEELKEKIKDRLMSVAATIRDLEDAHLLGLNTVTTKTHELEEVINKLNTTVVTDHSAEIRSIEEELKTLEQLLTQASIDKVNIATDLQTVSEKQLSIEKALHTEQDTLTATIDTELKNLVAEHAQIRSELTVAQTDLQKLESQPNICPYCGQTLKINLQEHLKQVEHKKALTENLTSKELFVANSIKSKEAEKSAIKEQIIAKYKQIAEAEATNKAKLSIKLQEIDRSITNYTQQQGILSGNLATLQYKQAHEAKELKDLADLKQKLEQEITETQAQLKANEQEQLKWSAHLAVLRKMETYSQRDFRGYLLTNVIEQLNIIIKRYSMIVFGTDNLSLTIDRNDLDILYKDKLIETLSGGERTRVDLIIQLALRELLNNYFNYSSNIVVLDEITDFLDETSCEAVVNLLINILTDVESIFIISHRLDALNLPIDSEIVVVKDANEISSVVSS